MPRNRRGSGVRNSQSFEEQIQGVRDFFGLDKRTIYRRDSNGQKIEIEQERRDGEWVTIEEDPIPGDFGYREPNVGESGAGVKRTGPHDNGGIGNLPPDYKETERQAFEQAEEWQRQKSDTKPESGEEEDKRLSFEVENPTTTVNKRQTGEKFAPAFGKSQLRYPYETTESAQDYIRFSIFKYKRAKRELRGDNNRTQAVFSRGTGDVTVATNPRDLLGSILLPVPAQVTDSNTASYGSNNLNAFAAAGFEKALDVATGAPEDVVSNGINAIKSFAKLGVDNRSLLVTSLVANAVNQLGANLDINSVLARSSGQIINPNMELLFNAPTLRQFKFQFKFTPRFEKETLEVKRIIKAFKKNMSPKSGQTGQTLTTPNIFQLQYVKGNGRPQGFLHQFKLCALTDISVNYTGDGTYATYYDGTPVSMTMALAFNELSPVYNEDYDLRDNRGGVGF